MSVNAQLTERNLTTIKNVMYSRLDQLFQELNDLNKGDGTNSENKSKPGKSESKKE